MFASRTISREGAEGRGERERRREEGSSVGRKERGVEGGAERGGVWGHWHWSVENLGRELMGWFSLNRFFPSGFFGG